jgi:hypothetical protein
LIITGVFIWSQQASVRSLSPLGSVHYIVTMSHIWPNDKWAQIQKGHPDFLWRTTSRNCAQVLIVIDADSGFWRFTSIDWPDVQRNATPNIGAFWGWRCPGNISPSYALFCIMSWCPQCWSIWNGHRLRTAFL